MRKKGGELKYNVPYPHMNLARAKTYSLTLLTSCSHHQHGIFSRVVLCPHANAWVSEDIVGL